MEDNYINMQSSYYDIYEDLEKDFLSEKPYKYIVTNHGIGGGWDKPLAWVSSNKIIIEIGIGVLTSVIVDVIISTFKFYKDKKSTKNHPSKNVIVHNGDLILHIIIDGVSIGYVGEENIDMINDEFIDKVKNDFINEYKNQIKSFESK